MRARAHRVAVLDFSLESSDPHNREGLQVLDALRRSDPGCAAILLTGFATVELAVSVLTETGAFSCLRKEAFSRSQFRHWYKKRSACRRLPHSPDRQNPGAAPDRDIPSIAAGTGSRRRR